MVYNSEEVKDPTFIILEDDVLSKIVFKKNDGSTLVVPLADLGDIEAVKAALIGIYVPTAEVIRTTTDQTKDGSLQLGAAVGKGLTFPASIANFKSGLHSTQATFNGQVDDVLNLGLNIVPGQPAVKAVEAESQLQLAMELFWRGPGTERYTEFNLDYQNPDGTHVFRPMSWYSDRLTHENGWSFRGGHWKYASDDTDDVIVMTDAGLKIHGFNLTPRNLSGVGHTYPTFQPIAQDVCRLITMPKGTPAPGERASVTVYSTDYMADPVNWQRALLSANSDGALDIFTEKGGTGVAGPIYLHARKVEIKTDGKIIMGNKLSMAGQSSGSVDVIDNTTSAFYTRIAAQNGTLRMLGGGVFEVLNTASTDGIRLMHDSTYAVLDSFTSAVSMRKAGTEMARWDTPASGEAAVLLRVNDGAVTSVRRVTVGAADSGGVGKRMLVVAN